MHMTPIASNRTDGMPSLVQDIGQIPFSAVVKYDVTTQTHQLAVSRKRVFQEELRPTRQILNTALWVWTVVCIQPSLVVQAYYEIVKNETTSALAANLIR